METYKARVVNVNDANGIEIAFVYYGSFTGNVHFDQILPTSQRYEKAKELKVGDEVYAAPGDCDKIYHFMINSPLKRLYVRTLKTLWADLKLFFEY